MDTLGSLCAGIEVTWESDRIRRPGFRAGFTSSHHTRQTSHPQTSALPRPPSLPHPSQHACLLSLIMRGTENKTFSSKEISGCNRLLLTLVGRRDLLMPSKHSLTRAWRIFHSPPSARPNYLIPPSHAGNNFPEVSSRLQQLCRADFKSTQRSSVSCFPGDTDVAAWCCHRHTPRMLRPCNQEPLPRPVPATAPLNASRWPND